MATYNVLIMGASYGSLLAIKLLFAGNRIKLVCLPAEAEAINKEGARVRLPIKGRKDPSRSTRASCRERCRPMDRAWSSPPTTTSWLWRCRSRSTVHQECASSPGVAKARSPCMSIMNMPPLPYLKRIPGLATDTLRSCYTDATVWEEFDPALMTLVQPGPAGLSAAGGKDQRVAGHAAHQFQGGPFRFDEQTAMLRRMAADIEAIRYDCDGGKVELPVKLKVHDLVFVPLAKWAMLLTGNYRCVQKDAPAQSRMPCTAISRRRGRSMTGCASFASNWSIARRSRALREIRSRRARTGATSSAARALFAGAPNIERVDRLVQTSPRRRGCAILPWMRRSLWSMRGSRLIAKLPRDLRGGAVSPSGRSR